MTTTGSGVSADAGTPRPGTFRIDREGVWRHEGVEITHPGVLLNLYANLRADGPMHYLALGPTRVPVEVDDTPFVVVRLEVLPEAGRAHAHLSDGSTEPLALDTLRLDAQGVPRCLVKGGRFRARLSVPAWLQLAAHVEPGPVSGQVRLVLGERRLTIPVDA